MNKQLKNHPETPIEAMEHALLLAERLQMMHNIPETDDLRRELMRLYRFMRRYMDAEAMHTDKLKPRKEMISVSGLVHSIVQEAQSEAILRGMTLQEDSDASVFVSGDSELLHRILWNLLQNAMSAAGNEGKVLIQSRIFGESCRITVFDNGEGFEGCDPQMLFREAPDCTGFGVIRTFLNLYQTELHFERQGEYTAVSFFLPRVIDLPELHTPEDENRYLQGISDAEVELSSLAKVEQC